MCELGSNLPSEKPQAPGHPVRSVGASVSGCTPLQCRPDLLLPTFWGLHLPSSSKDRYQDSTKCKNPAPFPDAMASPHPLDPLTPEEIALVGFKSCMHLYGKENIRILTSKYRQLVSSVNMSQAQISSSASSHSGRRLRKR